MLFRFCSAFYLLLFYNLSAQDKYASTKSLIRTEINKLKTGRSIDVSYSLLSPEGKEIYSYNEGINRTPASTLKIYTTGSALDLLGKDFRYSTFLEYDGNIDQCGVLKGNVYIRGTGDPTFGSERFENNFNYAQIINLLGDEVKKLGITRIDGDIVGDNSYFSECLTPPTWPFDDVANYYGAAPNGLCINENSYKVFFQPGPKIGSPTTLIGTDPENIPDLLLKNEVKTSYPGSGDRAVIMHDPTTREKLIVGTIPSGVKAFFIRGSIPDPAQLTASLLAEDLRKKGIDIKGGPFSIYNLKNKYTNRKRNIIYSHLSPPLIDIVQQVNMKSHNLFAETLTITLGKVFRGIGNYEKGMEVVLEYWQSKGVSLKESDLYDGSGLSPLNKISTRILTDMLFNIKQDESFQNFLATLPVVGVSGTLKNFCKNNPAKGKVYAKSGSIEGVRSYAGYAVTKSGDYVSFALIINNYKGNFYALTPQLEKIMSLMTQIP